MDELKERIKKLAERQGIEEKKEQVRKLEKEATQSSFWEDHQIAAKKMRDLAEWQRAVEKIEWLQELVAEAKEDLQAKDELIKELEKLEKETYLSVPFADENAFFSIHAGQGGTEAMDWAEMLYRMYTRYIEKKGWRFEEIDIRPGEEAGIKNVTISVEGKYAYGYLQAEKGVHRLVRQSPFNADKLRQTSFALVEVWPIVENNQEIDIKEEDLEWSFFRSSGHGGQNVNKVSTAVRLKYKPTNFVITSQAQRSQHQNRQTALNLLKSKLWQKRQEEKKSEEKSLKGDYKQPGWGNQIRSYVLHPYQMVKDLRTQVETSQTGKVLDGDLDQFIEAYLKIQVDI